MFRVVWPQNNVPETREIEPGIFVDDIGFGGVEGVGADMLSVDPAWERHVRYGGYGGIAYHHISDTYIALFCNFIACGIWEAVYILDGLLENRSDIQPDTLHADTHGQSEPVFGLAHLLGIKLYPRMRNWNDVVFYRPEKSSTYRHIDALFDQVVDWALIERHWPDMMQVVLSIQAGTDAAIHAIAQARQSQSHQYAP